MRSPLWSVIGLILGNIALAAAILLLAIYVHWAVAILAASVLGVVLFFWLGPGARLIALALVLLASVGVVAVVTIVRDGPAGSPIEQAVREQFRGGAIGTDRPLRVSCTPTGDRYKTADVYWCQTYFSATLEGTWPVCAALVERPFPSSTERQLVLAAGRQGFLDLRGDPLTRKECAPELLASQAPGPR